jgi:hypothetical protein
MVHVVQPAAGGLFGADVDRLFWSRLDSVADNLGCITAVKPEAWKPHFRTYKFQGLSHSIVLATPDNWGLVMVAATGPRTFWDRVLLGLDKAGMDVTDSWHAVTPHGELVPLPTENQVLTLAGFPHLDPSQRR